MRATKQSAQPESQIPTAQNWVSVSEAPGSSFDIVSGAGRDSVIDGFRASTTWRRLAVWSFFAVSLAYAISVVAREPIDVSDFRYVWLAGELWSKGAGPYSPEFVKSAGRFIPITTAPILIWVYPPHWEWLAVPLSWLPPFSAFKAWIAAELAMVVAGGYLLWKAAGQPPNRVLMLGVALSSTCVVWGVRTGQPVIVAAFGLCVIVYALAYESTPLLVTGIVLAALKPSVAAPFIIGLLFMPKGMKALGIAALTLLGLSIPSLLADTPLDILRGVMGSGYDAIPYNQAKAMNGFAHALDAFGFHISTIASLALAIGVSCALLWKRRNLRDYLRACSACTAFFVTLHPYDIVVLFLLLPFAPDWLVVLAVALAWRAENMAKLLGDTSATLFTVASAIAFAAVLSSFFKTLGASSTDCDRTLTDAGYFRSVE